MSVCQHRRCKNSSVEICPARSASRIERVGWIHLLLLTDCNSQDLDITAEPAKVGLLNPGLRCAFRWNYPWTKLQEKPEGNLETSPIWRAQVLHLDLLEGADPHLNHEMGCELALWIERPQEHGSVQLVPLSKRENSLSGMPFTLRVIDKVQKVTQKIIQGPEKMYCSGRRNRALSVKLGKSKVATCFVYARWSIFIGIKQQYWRSPGQVHRDIAKLVTKAASELISW